MRNLTYREILERLIAKAFRAKEYLAAIYYSERLSGVACASWEKFKGSWAGERWVAQHQQQADQMAAARRRWP
jgi:hypothetical protein